MLSDSKQRQMALNTRQSYIVQAPAGSGKTALLVYRLLTLLTQVDAVEKILAITFTRKATQEMQHRFFELLTKAEENEKSEDNFEQQGIALAQKVLAQDKKYQWQLLHRPHQLQIMTIDALCQRLSAHMPWLSRLGGRPRTVEDAQSHYLAVIDECLHSVIDAPDSAVGKSVRQVLVSVDFHYGQMRQLCMQLLQKRDQWIRYFLQQDKEKMRDMLQSAWQQVSADALMLLHESVDEHVLEELVSILHSSYQHYQSDAHDVKEVEIFPKPIMDKNEFSLAHWQVIYNTLIKKDGEYRKTVTKKNGFPAQDKALKQRIVALIEPCAQNVAFTQALEQVQYLPNSAFNDIDWQALQALQLVLKTLSGLLLLRFNSLGECDHIEVNLRANWALDQFAQPTELALALDHRLQHILVDEFQDTSHSQLQLLKNLTRGWQLTQKNQAQQTLFLVGDPMQSIYRFREADVSLFMKIADNATEKILENIDIEFLQLRENFRSSNALVTWFNQVFSQSFARSNNTFKGAIQYAQASSHKANEDGLSEVVQQQWYTDHQQELMQVAQWCKQFLEHRPLTTQCAILVRSRTHLPLLLATLTQQKIAYQGVDIFSLNDLPAIQDIISLAKAISRESDELAWLSLLRGPWLGLSLIELSVFAQSDKSIWQQIIQKKHKTTLSELTQKRLAHFEKIMRQAFIERQQVPLFCLVRWAWQQLGGEHTLLGASQQDANQCFALIKAKEQGGDILSWQALEQSLASKYVSTVSKESARIVISTMHKAKGLQYDTVILPFLAKSTAAMDKELMLWTERTTRCEQRQLLIAPVHSQKQDNPHYTYLHWLYKQREDNEMIRLLYVACTRAQKQLLLSATLKARENGDCTPPANSLLAKIWKQCDTLFVENSSVKAHEKFAPDRTLSRLPESFFEQAEVVASLPKNLVNVSKKVSRRIETPIESAKRAIGLVLHSWLQFRQQHLLTLSIDNDIRRMWQQQLLLQQCPQSYLPLAIARLKKAIHAMQSSEVAAFILSSYPIEDNELTLQSVQSTGVVTCQIDRSFVDEKNVRWIVDYKTTDTEQKDQKIFAEQHTRQHYFEKMQNYANLMSTIDNREIKIGVYYPLMDQWVAWDYQRT